MHLDQRYHGNFEIVNEEYFAGVVPQIRVLTSEDRRFLSACGVSTEGL